ncbi:hypothetical protein HIK14_13000 [Cronobacter sakazakii]|nr:hypothetical protein [Cronobacter sakazakii]
MINPCFDDNFFNKETITNHKQRTDRSGIIENRDGSTMYVAETITIHTDEEDEVSNNKTYPQELLHALKISWPFLLVVIAAVFGFFQLTQSRIDTQMAEVRAQLLEARKDASSDNAALRSNMNEGLNRIADKLSDIDKTLTAIQIEQATQKAQSDQKDK